MTNNDYQRIQTYSLLLIAVVLGGAALAWLKPVLLPFVLSLMLSVGLMPIVRWLESHLRLPSWLSVFVALSIGLIIFAGLSLLVGQSLRTAVDQTDEMEARLHGVYELVLTKTQAAGVDIDRAAVSQKLKELPIGRTFGTIASKLLNAVSDSFLVLFFMVYLLQSTAERQEAKDSIAARIRQRVRKYLSMKLGLSLLTGALVWLVLTFFGVPMAAMFGVLTVVLNFIPSVGSIVATLLPMPFVLLNPDISSTDVVLILVVCGLIQLVIGNVLEPRMMGDSLELHPITILIALVFWGTLWGVPGMFLGTPLTAVLCILMNEFPPTQQFASLLAGKSTHASSTVQDTTAALEE